MSHFHIFLQEIDLDKIESHVNTIKSAVTDTTYKLSKLEHTLFSHQIKHLFDKLNKILAQLDTFRPTRFKRGLLNPLGTVIKSITGNLDNEDALKFENALQILNKNDQMLSQTFNKHITLYKEMTIQQNQIISNLSINQRRLEKALSFVINVTNNENERTIHFAQLLQIFAIISENAQDLLNEINRLENILAFSRNRSVHHSILSVKDLNSIMIILKNSYQLEQILALDIRNYYDILSLGSYITESKVVIVIKFPITSSTSYQLFKLCPVPNKYNKIIVPPAQFIATNSQEFVYLETECPKIESWHLCEQKIIHQVKAKPDCIQRLIYHQEIDVTCKITPISLTKEALTELDSHQYIITFPVETKVQLSCGHEKHRILHGSFLLSVPIGCKLKSQEITIVNLDNKIAGEPLEITPLGSQDYQNLNNTQHFRLRSTDLSSLHKIQGQITMEPKIEIPDLSSVYHTTIPLYTMVLLSASALIIVYVVYNRRKAKLEITSQDTATNVDVLATERRAAAFGVNITK